MSKNLFIVFFLQFCLSSYSQTIVFCVSDSIREFSVEASDESNSLQWEFVNGDGAQIIQGQNSDRVLIEFSSPGDFLLQLTEQTNNGCSTSRVLEIIVNPLPSVSFTTDNMCVNQETRFLNTSFSQSEIVSCMWSLPNYQFETENLNFTFFQELLFKNREKGQFYVAVLGSIFGTLFLLCSIHYLIRIHQRFLVKINYRYNIFSICFY